MLTMGLCGFAIYAFGNGVGGIKRDEPPLSVCCHFIMAAIGAAWMFHVNMR